MTDRPQFKLLDRLQRQRHVHRNRSRLYRGAFLVAALTVTAVGLVLLALPGPAFAIIPIGLYMLALEFDWAERLLERALRHADNAKNNSFVKSVGRFVKRRPKLTAALLAAFLTLIAILVAGLFAFDLVPDRFRG